MSRLEDLIEELCPDGVEYKKLGEITSSINIGINPRKFFKLNPPNADCFYVTVRELNGLNGVKKCAKTDLIDSNTVNLINSRANIEVDDILFSNTGTVGKLAIVVEKPIDWAVNEGIYVIKPLHDTINTRFLYYCLSSENVIKQYQTMYTGSTLKHVTQKCMKKIKVPIPPMEVQREIVRNLDNFTELTEELTEKLTEELTARKQQYEYYRNRLLKPVNPKENSNEIITLGDIGKVSMCKRIKKAETSSQGDIPFYKIGTFGGVADAFISLETFEKYRNAYSYPQKGDVLISASGTIGREVIFNGEPAYFQDSNIVWIANDESRVLNKYLYYYYQLQPWKASTGGTIARLYNDNISKTKIYAPSIEKQKQIVGILDKFDIIYNDLSAGLPAEIEARQKQYVYYRDKLLSFKEYKG